LIAYLSAFSNNPFCCHDILGQHLFAFLIAFVF